MKNLKLAIKTAKSYPYRTFIDWKITTWKETQEIYDSFTFTYKNNFICITLKNKDGSREIKRVGR